MFAGVDVVKWVVMGVSHSHSFAAFPSRMPRNKFPDEVLEMLRNGDITTGHAKVLMSINDKMKMIMAAETVVKDKLSVRDTEKLAARFNGEGDDDAVIKTEPKDKQMKNFFTEMELSLKDRLNRGVKISGNGNGKGKIVLTFEDKDDLCRLTNELISIENGNYNSEN